jgi:hypothetical protein
MNEARAYYRNSGLLSDAEWTTYIRTVESRTSSTNPYRLQ